MQAAGSMYRIEIFQETFLGTSGNRRTFVCLLILCLLRYHKTAFSCFVSNYYKAIVVGFVLNFINVFSPGVVFFVCFSSLKNFRQKVFHLMFHRLVN